MTKFIRQYRALVSDLDYSFKVDNNLGYKFLVGYTFLMVGLCVESVLLDLGVIVM